MPVQISNVSDGTATVILQLRELNAGESLTSTSELASISQVRYWELNLSQGSIANSTITLPIKGEVGLPNDPSLFVVAQSTDPLGVYSNLANRPQLETQMMGVLLVKVLLNFHFIL